MKPKLLCILHRSPPAHGAAKVGDFIADSRKLKKHYNCKFITIKSSDTIEDIGKINFKKIYLVLELYINILWELINFRPDKIYFTASIRSIALYRDILISTLWKFYRLFKPLDIYYHYHTKGVDKYTESSKKNLLLTSFFLKNINLVLLSPLLKNDFKNINSYKNILYLANGVENPYSDELEFQNMIESKYNDIKQINILYLSNMIKSKGYYDVLKLAQRYNKENIKFHFAGGWQNNEDKKDFFDFIEENKLSKNVVFHGFVNGNEKKELFKNAHLFVFPTRYENEAFPLSLLESLSYGVPVIATDEGSIPYIINEKCGIILDNIDKLPKVLMEAKEKLLNIKASKYCRIRYKENFSLEEFENNLVRIFK